MSAYTIDLVISIFLGFFIFQVADHLYRICGGYGDDCANLAISVFLGGSIILNFLYYVLFESSRKQSTFGKRICKIVVTNMKGHKISFWRATWRFIVKILLTIFTFGLVDLIFILFNKNNRSLHDILSCTVVIEKPSP